MFGFVKNWFATSNPTAKDLSYDELVEGLWGRSNLEIFLRLRLRDRWVKNFHQRHPGATVPSGFLMRFGALDRVASERLLQLMNETRTLREIPELSHEKLEKLLADSFPESMQ
jgi:hypothetical protein